MSFSRCRNPGATALAVAGLLLLPSISADPSARTNTLGITYRWIPAGAVTMGPDRFGGDRVQQALLSPYFMAETHATWSAHVRVRTWASNHGYRFQAPGQAGSHPTTPADPRQPVVKQPRSDAMAWCNAMSEMEDRPPAYTVHGQVWRGGAPVPEKEDVVWHGRGYRLPTEAEMTHATRAGSRTAWFWGSDREGAVDHAWFRENSGGRSHPVATRKANGFGLFDMVGNVATVCWDLYGDYTREVVENPKGWDEGIFYLLKGGHWDSQVFDLETDYRSDLTGGSGGQITTGLRAVLPLW